MAARDHRQGVHTREDQHGVGWNLGSHYEEVSHQRYAVWDVDGRHRLRVQRHAPDMVWMSCNRVVQELEGVGSLTGRHMRSHCKKKLALAALPDEKGPINGIIPGDVQCSLLTHLHGGDTLIPAYCEVVSGLFDIDESAKRAYP